MPAPALNGLKRGAFFVALVFLCAPNQSRGADNAIAVVFSISGNVAVVALSGEKGRVELFDLLQAGSVIEVGPGSKVKIAYANGSRYALEDGTKATIATGGPQVSAGKVSPLESVPPLPHLVALANAAGTRSAVTRIRGGPDRIGNLYPFADSAALPEDAVLRFTPFEGATRYRVEVEDDSGRTVLDAETESSVLAVPAGVLRPGARYYWSVRTVERIGPTMRAEREFSTLPEEDIRRRAALRSVLVKAGDPESLAFLAAIDRRLGLLLEAREEFKAALMKSPTDVALQKAVSEIDALFTEDGNGRP
jgi:hypothetical protein